MSILEKIGAVSGGISDLTNPALWLQNALVGGGTSATGISVTPESAMALSAYYACIRNVSEDIGGLPFKIFKALKPEGSEVVPNHPVHRVIHDASNESLASLTFWEVLLHWALGWGNAYAVIHKTPGNVVTALVPVHPALVTLLVDRNGVRYYRVRNDDGTNTNYSMEDMFHLRGIGDQWLGYSVARLGAESFGRALATQEFSAAFFGNGSTFSGIYKTPHKLDRPARERLKESWPSGLPNAHNPLFLEGGMEWQQISVNPQDAQMLETMVFTVEDVCRWFRMPLHKVQSMAASRFSNVEQTSREYVGDTLLPWIRRIEKEVNRKLLRPHEQGKLSAHFVIRALLRGDLKTQSAFYSSMTAIGAMSVNEVRAFEGMNPVEGGDEYRVQLNTGPIADADKPDDEPPSEPDEDTSRGRQVEGVSGVKRAYGRVFADIARRLATKETKALQRAAKRYGNDAKAFAEWSATFYSEHKAHAIEAMRDASLALADMICMRFGKETLPANVADAIVETLESGKVLGAADVSQVAARIGALENAPALAAEFMPDRIEAVVREALGD